MGRNWGMQEKINFQSVKCKHIVSGNSSSSFVVGGLFDKCLLNDGCRDAREIRHESLPCKIKKKLKKK